MKNHRATWEAAKQRPCRAARMSFPEYLLERAQAVAFAAFLHDARGAQVPADSVTELENICGEMLVELRRTRA